MDEATDLSAQVSVAVIGSRSEHEGEWAFLARVFRSWVPPLPRCSGERLIGSRAFEFAAALSVVLGVVFAFISATGPPE